jgi:hypothetical protein
LVITQKTLFAALRLDGSKLKADPLSIKKIVIFFQLYCRLSQSSDTDHPLKNMSMFKKITTIIIFSALLFAGYSQAQSTDMVLAKFRDEGFLHSQARGMLSEFTDVYGQRLTGSREYLAAANWAAAKMKTIGLENVHFENYCKDCRGWSLKTFNVEMVAPNYMHLVAYPMAMTRSTAGVVEGKLVSIESIRDMNSVKEKFAGKLKGKVILLGTEPRQRSLTDTIFKRYSDEELKRMEDKTMPLVKPTPLPELLDSWKVDDHLADEFFAFAEKEGALAVLQAQSAITGILHAQGTYNYLEGSAKSLPYFSIMAEHFGRFYRMLKQEVVPVIRLNLETSFYLEPENNVNIIGEIPGTDPSLKSEVVMVGGHFDSWHSATGATDNGVSCMVLMEALRILKQTGITPKRTIRICLWGGEEQAFIGSVAYATKHFGGLREAPNEESKKVTSYLNLDNGAGAIRGLYLQGNEFARPVFKKIFNGISSLCNGTLTIENTLSTDHETFDHYNIPSFQFIQDPISYGSVTHHTHLDLPEYVPEEDAKKNAVILAWTIYSIGEMDTMVPRKHKD